MSKQSNLLIDSNEMLVLQTRLAVVVGDRQAIALQQIHYWSQLNEKVKRKDHFFDDHWWVYNTWTGWKNDNFPFWSINTIRRVFADLEALGLIVIRSHKTLKRGLWVSVNYSQLESFSLEKGAPIKIRKLRSEKGVKDSKMESLSPQRFQNGQATSDPETIKEENKESSASSDAGTEIPLSNPETNVDEVKEKGKQTALQSRQSSEKKESGALPKTKSDYILLVEVVAQCFFGTPPDQVSAKKIGGRIGKIAGWLHGTSAPEGMDKLPYSAKPKHVQMYAEWWSKTYKTTRPKDPVKFIEGWREWGSKLKAKNGHGTVEQNAESKAEEWGINTFIWDSQEDSALKGEDR